MQLTKNFNLSEFDCNDGSTTPDNIIVNLQLLAEQLQVLRDYVGKPIKINSGYRSPHYNDSVVKGAKFSQHKLGTAADIRIDGLSSREVHGIVSELIKDGRMKEGGLGRYISKGFTHYDIRGNKVRWNG